MSEDTLTRKYLWQMDPKKRVNSAITAFTGKSVENKSQDLKCSTLEYRTIVSNQEGERMGEKRPIAGKFKIHKIAVT